MKFKLKSRGLILLSLLLVSLLVFVGCGEDEEVATYDISGEVVGLNSKDLEHVRVTADEQSASPETEGENKGKWSISDVDEGSTVRAIIDTEQTSQNFEFLQGEYSVNSDNDNIIFTADVEGKSYYGYQERLELACLSGEECGEKGTVARDVETVIVIDFEGDGIAPMQNDLLLEEQITIDNEQVDDFSVNFLNQQLDEEDIEDYKLPDNYYDEENNPTEGYDGVWEYWENVKTDYYYKSLMIRIPGRVAGDISVEIAENTFVDANGQEIRKIQTKPLALSDNTRLDDTEADIISLDHYNQELAVFNSDFTEVGDDLMPSIDAIFGFDTACNGAEIIKIAGENVERIAEDSDNFVVNEGDKLVVRAEDGSTTEYAINLVSGVDDLTLNSKQDTMSDKYYNLTKATKDEFGRIESKASWLHWEIPPSEVANGLKYADEIIDDVGTELKIVRGDEINRSTYHNEQGYWPEDDMWDSTDRSFEGLNCLIEAEKDFDKDNIIDGIGYNVVLQAIDGSIAVYDLILEQPRNTAELNNLYDEDESSYEDRDDKVFNIDNENNLITLRSDLDDGSLVTAEHPEDNADNPSAEERDVLATAELNLLEAIEGGTIADVEDNEVKVVAEDGRSEEVYDIEYAPGYVDSRVGNKNPYHIELDLGAEVSTRAIYNIDDLDKERFEVNINGEKVEVAELLCNDDQTYDLAIKLETKILAGDLVELSYSEDRANPYFIYDGNALAKDFNGKVVENELKPAEYDHDANANNTIANNPGQLNIEFDQNVEVNGDSEVVAEQFELVGDWAEIGDKAPEVVDVEAEASTVTLTFSHDILEADENIKLYYDADEKADEDVLALADADNRVVAKSFGYCCDEGQIANNITDVPELELNDEGEFAAEIVGGAEDIIELTFTEDLALNPELEEEIDFNDYFKVLVDNKEVEVEMIDGSNNLLELIIPEELIDHQSEVVLSYQPGLRSDSDLEALLMDAAQNHKVLDFFDVAVSNNLELAEYETARIGREDTKSYTASELIVNFTNQIGEARGIDFADIEFDCEHEARAETDGFSVELNGEEHEDISLSIVDNQLNVTLELYDEAGNYDGDVSFDLEDELRLTYDADEGHLVDAENPHIEVASFEAEAVNNLEGYDIEYANAFVREDKSNFVELYFSNDGKSLFCEDDAPIYCKDHANPRSIAEIDKEEKEDFLASLEVEGYEILAVERKNYDDEFNYLVLELDDYLPANKEIELSYDGSGYLVADKTASAKVNAFDVTLDADLDADGAMNRVKPLKMESASVDSFIARDQIIIEFNKDVVGDNDVRLLSSDIETLHKNFIVDDSDYTVVDVNIIDGTNESNDGVKLTLSERINTAQKLNIQYKEASKATPYELSDGENNYLKESQIAIENNIEFPYISEVKATDFDTISIDFAQFDGGDPIELDRHGEVEIEFDGASETFAADANVNASSVSFTLDDMVVYEDEDEAKSVTISAPENSTLEMIIDYYNLAGDEKELVITDLPDNPVEIESASMANPGDNTVITLEMSHDVDQTSSYVLENLDVIKSNGVSVDTPNVKVEENEIEVELAERLSGDDGNLAVYYRGDRIVGDVNGHQIPAPNFSIDVNNSLLPEAEDISTDSSAEIEAIDGDDDFEEPEAIENNQIDVELEVEDNSGNAINGTRQVELIDEAVTDIDENEAARVAFDDEVEFDDGEAEIDFDATLPDADEDDEYDAGDEYEFYYEVRVYTDDGYVVIDTIELTVNP